MATVLPAGTSKLTPLQDRALRDVGELHVLEAHRALADDERLARPAGPGSPGCCSQDREHVVDVDERLFDLAVEHAHEVQRHVELHQHGVDQHEAADRVRAPP